MALVAKTYKSTNGASIDENGVRHLGILSRAPLVLMSCTSSFVPFDRNVADLIADRLQRPFGLVLQVWSSLEKRLEDGGQYLRCLADSVARHVAQYPGNAIWLACNTRREVEIARSFGLQAHFLSHNAFINEDIFKPLGDEPRCFDAVYSAQMWVRKRHELAVGLPSLYLVFAMHLREAMGRFREVRTLLPHAALANGDPTGPQGHVYLAQSDVNRAYNQARVGLCLSAYEGASLAASEYQLAGLPVVSTPSLGGRETFFHHPWCDICEPTADAVAAAVQRKIGATFDPAVVRAGALADLNDMRGHWVAAMGEIMSQLGGDTGQFEHAFPALRTNWCGLPFRSLDELVSALNDRERGCEQYRRQPIGTFVRP